MTAALETLLEQAERLRDEARVAVLQADESVQRARTQADQLRLYRDEYRQRHPAQGGRSASIEVLRTHYAFMQRLDQSLGHQQIQLQAAQGRAATHRAALLSAETRLASVRKIRDRRAHETQRSEHRREQRRADDAGQQRSAWRDPGSVSEQRRAWHDPVDARATQ